MSKCKSSLKNSSSNFTIIPFASGIEKSITTNSNGDVGTCLAIPFGNGINDIPLSGKPGDNLQVTSQGIIRLSFVLPTDITIKRFYVTPTLLNITGTFSKAIVYFELLKNSFSDLNIFTELDPPVIIKYKISRISDLPITFIKKNRANIKVPKGISLIFIAYVTSKGNNNEKVSLSLTTNGGLLLK